MPLVFVHGVSVRDGKEYGENLRARDGLFRQFALNGVVSNPEKAHIENPYWGQYGATLAFNNASLPDGQYQEFGAGQSIFEEILNELAPDVQAPAQDQVLVTLARVSLPRAVDALWAAGAFTESEAAVGQTLADAAVVALDYVEHVPKPEWLTRVQNDDEFVDELLKALAAWKPQQATVESFGVSDIWNHLKTSALNLGSSASRFVVNPATRAIRPWVNGKVSLFIGDVFTYLKNRDQPGGGKIAAEVQRALERADNARTSGDSKLIVVAHSMGGNITYDILTSFAPRIAVDLFVTVGSQVGLFEELKLFRSSDQTIVSPKTVAKPPNVTRWINVMDPNDVLAYSTSRIFAQSLDTTFDNKAPVWTAHSSYFYQPSFHQRLQRRILEN